MSSLLDEDALETEGASSRRERNRQRRQSRRSKRGFVVLAVVVVLLLVIAVVGWIGFGDRITTMLGGNDYQGEGNGTAVEFTVEAGDTGTTIGQRLAEAGVVKTSEAFIDEVVARDPEPTFMPGTFAMQLEMSASAAVDALVDEGNLLAGSFVVPEGSTMTDIFAIIEADLEIPASELEAAAADLAAFDVPAEATSLEGFLFPATYEFPPGTDAATVLHRMVDRANEALDDAGVAPEERWDVIRLASLIQKEAGLRDDYYKVSRVFLNRLEIGMDLQSDATVAYGTGNTHRVETTDAERADASNIYNTYVHGGMVVGPISNPGDLAIDAALHPADGSWVYFVTWNLETGETIFSETWEEHEVAVAKWLQWMDEHPEYG